MRRAAAAALALLAAAASVAQTPGHADIWTVFAELLAGDPHARRDVEAWRSAHGRADETATAGWDQQGIDSDALLGAAPGGADNNLLVTERAGQGGLVAELRSNRPVAEIVPAGWTERLRYGEIDFHPRHAAVLIITRGDPDHLVFARARRWRQGRAACWGPIRGVAVYRRGSVSPPIREDLARRTTELLAPVQDFAICERFEGTAQTGFRRTRFLPDGRLLHLQNHHSTTTVRPLPLSRLFD